jgi:hypothetical protein
MIAIIMSHKANKKYKNIENPKNSKRRLLLFNVRDLEVHKLRRKSSKAFMARIILIYTINVCLSIIYIVIRLSLPFSFPSSIQIVIKRIPRNKEKFTLARSRGRLVSFSTFNTFH